MSRIDKLIKEKCPNGVEYKRLSNVIPVNRGKRLTKSQLKEDGIYKVYHGSKDVPLGMYDEYNTPGDTVIVVNTGGIGGVKYLKDNFWCSDGSFNLGHNDILNNKFLYYYLSQYEDYFVSQKRVGGVPTIDRNVVENIKIPVPPIEVQEEIVEILDKFVELEAELEAELDARKSQYEFWRGSIFTIGCETKKLSEIANVIDSLHATPKYVDEGYPMIRVADVKFGVVNTTNALKVSEDDYKKFISKYKPTKNDIIMSRVGTYGNICIVGEEDVCLGQNTSIIHSKINPKYLYYCLCSFNVQEWIKNNVKGAGYKSLSLANINDIPVKVPSIEIQERIVNILDKFDNLVNDISIGLPAEIEARRKQYEYYRNKLLSFEELTNE